jgi:antitoxin PrlF
MPAPKKRKPSTSKTSGTEYLGKQTRTGNSSGFRFESALFKSHPEFKGEVRAHIIAPGRMLVTAETEVRTTADPVMAAFLAFVAQDITQSPQNIRPLDEKLVKRVDKLTKGILVSPDEDLGDNLLL